MPLSHLTLRPLGEKHLMTPPYLKPAPKNRARLLSEVRSRPRLPLQAPPSPCIPLHPGEPASRNQVAASTEAAIQPDGALPHMRLPALAALAPAASVPALCSAGCATSPAPWAGQPPSHVAGGVGAGCQRAGAVQRGLRQRAVIGFGRAQRRRAGRRGGRPICARARSGSTCAGVGFRAGPGHANTKVALHAKGGAGKLKCSTESLRWSTTYADGVSASTPGFGCTQGSATEGDTSPSGYSSGASSDASRPTTLDKSLGARTGVALARCRAAWPRLRRRQRRDTAQRAKVGLTLLRIAGAGRPGRRQRPGVPAIRRTLQALPCTPYGTSALQRAGGQPGPRLVSGHTWQVRFQTLMSGFKDSPAHTGTGTIITTTTTTCHAKSIHVNDLNLTITNHFSCFITLQDERSATSSHADRQCSAPPPLSKGRAGQRAWRAVVGGLLVDALQDLLQDGLVLL